MTYYWLFSTTTVEGTRAEIVATEEQRRPAKMMYSEGGWATTGSTMFTSLEALHEAEGMRVRCQECGGWIMAIGGREELARMEQDQRCWSCTECEKFIAKQRSKDPSVVVIDGRVYGIGKKPAPGSNRSFLGFGGRKFCIERKQVDGQGQLTGETEVIVSHNLWAGMTIPLCYRERIPDTAKFVGGAREHQSKDGTVYWEESR